MKLKEIPAIFGQTAADFCKDICSPQQWNNYTSERRGAVSKFYSKVSIISGLCFEQIWFQDVFEHPDGENPETPYYWLNLAHEALRVAQTKGFDTSEMQKAILAYYNTLSDFSPEALEEEE